MIKKIFIIFNALLFVLFSASCSNKNTDSEDTDSFVKVGYSYGRIDDYLFNNRVTIGIGNSLFDANNEKILSIDEDYYRGIKNICISVYVDDDQTAIERIEIKSEAFFTRKYAVNSPDKKISIDEYRKTYEFNLRDYEIKDYVKFVISYDWFYKDEETHHSKELCLYGEFVDGFFLIKKKESNWWSYG